LISCASCSTSSTLLRGSWTGASSPVVTGISGTIVNQNKILECTTWKTGDVASFVSPGANFNTLKTFKCADGYVPAAIAGTLTNNAFAPASATIN